MITVILCAAGSGSRAGLGENKILRELNGMSVLCHSLSAFAPFADEMLVTCRSEDEARILPLLAPYPGARTVRGGETRSRSVFSALCEARGDIVLIHDAARPFVTAKIIRGCIESVKKDGSGVCAVPVTDTVACVFEGRIADMPPRNTLCALQTPQGFLTAPLRRAYEAAMAEGREFTDDSGVYAAYCAPPRLCEGDPFNKKLTYFEDFPAERVGSGVDTHAFGAPKEGATITLCGVKLPSHAPLLAHSDGDVAVHALMDALLSAIGEKDIGHLFPDTDPALAGADSMQLLGTVADMVRAKSFTVKNVCITILAERPRLAPFIEEMCARLREALGCGCVAVAAGTNEGLGYVGEGKGITAVARVLLCGSPR